jgi:hypothetical protein
MLKTFLQKPMLLISIFFFIGCGEITYDEQNTTNPTIKSDNLPTSQNNDDNQTVTESEVDSAQQANETISGTETTNQKLDDIIEVINTMDSNSTNEVQKVAIFNWLEVITSEVNELTTKDFTQLVNTYKDLPLFPINEKVFSTSENFGNYISDNGHIGLISDTFVILKGDCNSTHVENSIILCTENAEITSLNNDIIIANGTINLTGTITTAENPLGALIYNKKSLESTSLDNSVILFSNPIKYTSIENSDCINTGEVSGSSGTCNEITTNNLTEN